MSYFLDTYAMIEIIKGNPRYKKYIGKQLFTCVFNLYELYYALLKDYDKIIAEKYFLIFKKNLIHFKDFHIFEASKFKLENKKNRLSYADCLGYVLAVGEDMKFLTGDKEFGGRVGVEFVRK